MLHDLLRLGCLRRLLLHHHLQRQILLILEFGHLLQSLDVLAQDDDLRLGLPQALLCLHDVQLGHSLQNLVLLHLILGLLLVLGGLQTQILDFDIDVLDLHFQLGALLAHLSELPRQLLDLMAGRRGSRCLGALRLQAAEDVRDLRRRDRARRRLLDPLAAPRQIVAHFAVGTESRLLGLDLERLRGPLAPNVQLRVVVHIGVEPHLCLVAVVALAPRSQHCHDLCAK
mmetsp:Transcript_127141/g.406773  ORF Transcript_127141/g.406773 Transcript_127141/m.406773 type:complete len:228 (+) Transcript_127141:1400-2083(+)